MTYGQLEGRVVLSPVAIGTLPFSLHVGFKVLNMEQGKGRP